MTLPGPARVGVEATINAQWFERMLCRYQHELWTETRHFAGARPKELRYYFASAEDEVSVFHSI